MNHDQKYYESITRCLATYQFVEEVLKGLLREFEMLVHIQLRPYIDYDMHAKNQSIQDAALGRLIENYKIYDSDKDLISKLRKIKKKRDDVAHRSFLVDDELLDDSVKAPELIKDLEHANQEAQEVKKILFEKWHLVDELNKKLNAEQGARYNSGQEPELWNQQGQINPET